LPPVTEPPSAQPTDNAPHVLPSISEATRRQLQQSFNNFLRQSRTDVAGLTAAQRDQLFEQYLARYLAQEQVRAGSVQAPTQPFSKAPEPPAPPAPAAAPEAPRITPPPATPRRVVINYKSTSDGARIAAARMSSVLDASARTELRPVDNVPRTPAIRYYSPEDRDAARRLATTLAGEQNQPSDAWSVQDYSGSRPQPPAGTIEVWLPPS
jgi:hypothetical protein